MLFDLILLFYYYYAIISHKQFSGLEKVFGEI